MAKNKDAYARARAMIDEDFQEDPNATYQEDQEAIDAANKTLRSGSKFQSEVERDTFMKASSEEKKKIAAEALAKRRKGK